MSGRRSAGHSALPLAESTGTAKGSYYDDIHLNSAIGAGVLDTTRNQERHPRSYIHSRLAVWVVLDGVGV